MNSVGGEGERENVWLGFSMRYRRSKGDGTVEVEVTRGEAARAIFGGEPMDVDGGAVRVSLPHDGEAHSPALTLVG